jgi:hypothetical protein
MKKIILTLFTFLCFGVSIAGAETLISFGVPSVACDFFTTAGFASAILMPITPMQTGIVVAYKNRELIADKIMPIDMILGGKKEFSWFERTTGDNFGIQDTKVSRFSKPNQIFFDGDPKADKCGSHALEAPLSNEDIEQLTPEERTKLMNRTFESVTNRLLLGREVRVAKLAADPANYLSSQVTNVAASDRLNNLDADIYEMIADALDGALVRPNLIGMNQAVWGKLRVHPSIVSAIYPNGNGGAVVTKEQVATLFEVNEIVVGKALINNAKNPKTLNLAQAWECDIFAHYQEPFSTLMEGVAWGITAQSGDRVATSRVDESIGLSGGTFLKSGVSQKEVVVGKPAGVLLKGIYAPPVKA